MNVFDFNRILGTSDPYAEVRIKGDIAVKKTKTIKKNLNPKWNEEFTLYDSIDRLSFNFGLEMLKVLKMISLALR